MYSEKKARYSSERLPVGDMRDEFVIGAASVDWGGFGKEKDQQAAGRFEGWMIRINFAPDFSPASLMTLLRESGGLPETLVKRPLAEEILRRALMEKGRPESGKLTDGDLLNIANQLRGFTLTPTGRKGWKEAQITREESLFLR